MTRLDICRLRRRLIVTRMRGRAPLTVAQIAALVPEARAKVGTIRLDVRRLEASGALSRGPLVFGHEWGSRRSTRYATYTATGD